MSVFKATKNRSDSGKFKATDRRSYDPSFVYSWEKENKKAYDSLEDYRQRINSGGYLSADDLSNYRKALDTYVDTATRLRDVSKFLGQGTTEDDDRWNKSLSQLESSYRDISDYYSGFKDADEYATALRHQEYQEKHAGKSVEDIGVIIDEMEPSEEREWLRSYKASRELENYADMQKNADFAEKSQYSSTANGKERTWTQILFDQYPDEASGYDNLMYEAVNGNESALAYMGAQGSQKYGPDNPIGALVGMREETPNSRVMTEQEVGIFNYLYATQGEEAAEDYLNKLQETLNYRTANEMFKTMENKPLAEIAFQFVVGLEQASRGIAGVIDALTGKEAYTNPSDIQIAGGMAREDLEDVDLKWYNFKDGSWENQKIFGNSLGQFAADAVSTTANMIPSILASSVVSMANPVAGMVVGNTLMGASAAGNAYRDTINRGYGKDEARFYSAAVGASEAILQYALGGISKLGGVSSKLTKAVAGIDNGILRFALQYGGKIVSESAEEGLQEILDPLFQNAILHADEDIDWGAAAYSALLGGLSAGLFEGPGLVAGNVATSGKAKKMYGTSQQELVCEALEINPNNAFAQKMQGRLDNGKQLSGGQLNRLVQQNEAALTAQEMANIQRATESRLTELGETGDVAAIAAALTKQAAGEKLSRAEQKLISDSKYGQRVANELNTKNIKSGEYSSEWAQKLDTQRINVQEYSSLVEAAQLPQESAEIAGSQVVTEAPKAAQASQVAPVEAPTATVPVNDQQVTGKVTEKASEAEEPKAKTVTLEDLSKKYGAQAKAMIHTYQARQDVAKYDAAYKAAYDMGKSGVSFNYVKGNQAASYLTDTQRELAYEAGKAASDTAAKEQDTKNKTAANGKTGRRKGTVKGEGVTIADLKQTFNDTQGKAYKYLSTVAEVTGIDIMLYRSEAGPDGKFQGAQGRFSGSEPGTIYIDLNAGLSEIKSVDDLAKYAMLRTFAHEFTHFIENWNPIQYNEFRKVVFDTLTERGENVHDLIEDKQARNPGMSYDKASREVVAEAMTDILLDTNFVQELAENHKTIFQKLLDKLKEFVENLRDYFNSIGHNPSSEANALKEQVGETVKYLDSIVDIFDRISVEAVDNYQLTVAVDEVTGETSIVETKVETTVEETATEVEENAPEIDESTPAVEETQEVPFNQRTLSLLKSTGRVGAVALDGQKYVTNGYILLPTTSAGFKYAHVELNAATMNAEVVKKTFENANTLVTEAPMEAKAGVDAVYIFDVGGKKLYFKKKLFTHIDGGLLYAGQYNGGGVIKSVNEDGSIRGYLLGLKNVVESKVADMKPSKLKSFSKKMQALIDAQTVTKPTQTETKASEPVAKQAESRTQTASEKLAAKLLSDNPVRNTADDSDQFQNRGYLDEHIPITMGMTETERYEILKDRSIAITAKTQTEKLRSIEEKIGQKAEDAILLTETDRKKLFVKIGKEFGVFNEYSNADVKLTFNFSRGNLKESVGKQRKNYFDFAKMLSCFDKIIDAAIGIEVHNRNDEGYKLDPTLKSVYVLLSAFEDGSDIVPVKLEIKEFIDKNNTLYVAIALESIKKDEVVKQGNTENGVTQNSRSSIIKIADLLSKINPLDKSFLKYVPTQFVSYSDESEQNQRRTNTLTDREVLALAAKQIEVTDLTPAEKDALDIFQKRLSKLEALQDERDEQGRLYKEQQFGAKVDRAAAAETLNRMHVLDGQIQKASAEVLTVEEKTVLKRVLQKARTVVEQQERQHGQEILKRWRDRRNNADAIKKYRDRLRGDVDELTNWVLHPDNKNVVKHIPDALKNTVIPFLSSINFMSKRSLGGGDPTVADKAFQERLKKLRNAIRPDSSDPDKLYADYTDLPPDFMDRLNTFVDTVDGIAQNNQGEFIINKMTSAELHELSKIVRTLKKYIMQMNRFHVNAMFQHVYEAGDNSIDFLGHMKRDTFTGGISNFIRWQTMRAAYAFERFGKGGEAIYDGLRRGQATLAFNTKKIEAFAKKAYSVEEVKAWEKEVKTIRLGPGKTITMHVSQIMSLYELNKREQARGHIYGDGFRPSTTKKVSEDGYRLTPGELNLILRELTPRQIEVADKLQQFMQKQGGEWGNYVTVVRFGEKQFGEENYFPINSDGRFLSAEAGEKPGATSLYALLNMGFTKQTQENAKNQIVVYSIFDVFANHMASMAQYNALALPLVDALKWFNYQQKSEPDENGYRTILGSVRDQMARVYGSPVEKAGTSGKNGFAEVFVINILKAFNGTAAQGTPYDTGLLKALHRYNLAQVSYNLRVVLQQPLAITRAAMLLDYASIIKGMKLSPSAIQKNIQEMQSHSGIAAWKSLGFYDVNVSRGLTELIKHDGSWVENVQNKGMWLAEKADTFTWAAIWSAAKEEVIRKQKLTPKSDGFYEAVTKLFENVIYKTQVVDSVLTKNEFMRDKGFGARSIGSFMSEATVDANMLVNSFDKLHMDMQRGMSLQQAWKQNRYAIGRTLYVYAIGQVLLAVVQSAADAWRDDDDYQEWYEKWLEAFWGLDGNLLNNLNPLNKLPLFSQFNEFVRGILAAGGFDIYSQMSNFVWADIAEQMEKGVEILVDNISGKDTNYEYYGGIYKLLQAVSGMTGLPMAGATREIVTAWNNIVGAMAPSLKIKTYEPSEKSQIKYAYLDGYLSAEEAVQELIKQGIAKNEYQARKIIEEWDTK